MKNLLLFSLFATLSYAATAQTNRVERDSLRKDASGKNVAVIEIELAFTDSMSFVPFAEADVRSKKTGNGNGTVFKDGKATLHFCVHCFPATLTIFSNDFKPVKIKLKKPGSYRVHSIIKYDKNYKAGSTL